MLRAFSTGFAGVGKHLAGYRPRARNGKTAPVSGCIGAQKNRPSRGGGLEWVGGWPAGRVS